MPALQSSLVLARDGSLVGEIGREQRTSVAIATLPKYVGRAFIAVEDKRFYQHDGVDVVGIAGAIKDKLIGRGGRGASTITQLLVGNMHPDVIDRRDLSLGRKLREQDAARLMEQHYTKAEILEAFLNQVHFGHGWYGVEAAARHYFGKHAAQLTLAEAASLAALPKSPVAYDPARFPARNRERRNTVLALMAEQGFVTRAAASAAQKQAVRTVPNGGLSVAAAYVADAARQKLDRLGIAVQNGGYRVYTTVDPSLQRAAEVALVEGAAAVEMRRGYRHPTFARHAAGRNDYLEGAVVAVDPLTGDIRALVGGRNYVGSPFNRATNALRQPGSSFKPFVYAAALAGSIPPNTQLADSALAIPLDARSVYRPENADGAFLGALTMREALILSRNPVAVQLWQRVGADSVIALARRLGITTPIAPFPASAIGASAVRPLEFVGAYAAFDNGGYAVEPRLVVRIEDQTGRVLWTAPPASPVPVLDPRVAFVVRDMMREAVDRGTGAAVRSHLSPLIPAAGKTGTTNDNTDVWFVGMTPEIVAGVWLGFDAPRPIGSRVAGGSLAAPIWGRMMARWYRGRQSADWNPPPGLVTAVLARRTGLLADSTVTTDQRYTEYFLAGTEPAALPFDPMSVFRLPPLSH
ncbi:MAG: hypothetical protein NVS1B4_19450 [Gemmatimonadaceae bacterium]